jgi:hypothetical protein
MSYFPAPGDSGSVTGDLGLGGAFMASWSCVLLRVNVLTSQQLHSGFSVNFDFICHFEFTLLGLIPPFQGRNTVAVFV